MQRATSLSLTATLRRSVCPHARRRAPIGTASPTLGACLVRGVTAIHAPRVDEFPVVDCAALLVDAGPDATTPARARALAQCRAALEQRGYFYAAGVEALSADYIEEVYRYSELAHDLPVDVKARFVRPAGTYSGGDVPGHEELAYEKGTVSTVRAWDYTRPQGAVREGDSYPGLDLLRPSFRDFADALYARQDVLARALYVAFAEMFGLPRDTFSRHLTGGDMGTVRLLYYPGTSRSEAETANAGISAHTDFEVFTLMHQNAPGLQLRPRGSEWVDAPVRPGEFVVFAGDVLERFTNGALKAAPHRVLRTAHCRQAIVRFLAMHPDTLVSPLPTFVGEGQEPAYTPVTMKRHMEVTMRELEEGKGSWDPVLNVSLSAIRKYS